MFLLLSSCPPPLRTLGGMQIIKQPKPPNILAAEDIAWCIVNLSLKEVSFLNHQLGRSQCDRIDH